MANACSIIARFCVAGFPIYQPCLRNNTPETFHRHCRPYIYDPAAAYLELGSFHPPEPDSGLSPHLATPRAAVQLNFSSTGISF